MNRSHGARPCASAALRTFTLSPHPRSDLAQVLNFCREQSLPFLVLGRGSNLLIRDGGVRGVVLCLAHPHFSRVEVAGERLRCGAGARLKAVAVEAPASGLERLGIFGRAFRAAWAVRCE